MPHVKLPHINTMTENSIFEHGISSKDIYFEVPFFPSHSLQVNADDFQ